MNNGDLQKEYSIFRRKLFYLFKLYKEILFDLNTSLFQPNKLDSTSIESIFEPLSDILLNISFTYINQPTLSKIIVDLKKKQHFIQKEIEHIKTLLNNINENNPNIQNQQLKNTISNLEYFNENLIQLQKYSNDVTIAFEKMFVDDKEILEQTIRATHIILNEIKLGVQLQEEIQKARLLNIFCEDLKKRSIEKEQDIDRLMANATKLGLAQRYTQEKENNNFAKWFWTVLVGIGLCSLFFLSDLPNTISKNLNKTTQMEQNTQKPIQNPPQSLSDCALNFLKNSSAYLALIWLILFASRRRNEANRLASDYAHKEVFASSYEAYQGEIEKLKKIHPNKSDELTELNAKLLDSMISVLSDNPAKSLDTKKTTDELPAKELVNFASEVIKLKGK